MLQAITSNYYNHSDKRTKFQIQKNTETD